MKIITNSKQQRALTIVTKLRKALFSENMNEKFIAIELLAELTDIIGGLKGLQDELARINAELYER